MVVNCKACGKADWTIVESKDDGTITIQCTNGGWKRVVYIPADKKICPICKGKGQIFVSTGLGVSFLQDCHNCEDGLIDK